MMKLSKKTILMAVAAVILAVVSSCGSKVNEEPPTLYMAFATLDSTGNTGSTFSVQEGPDTEPVILTSSVVLNPSNFPVNDRYVITYSTSDDKPYTAGPIDLYSVTYAFTDELQEASPSEIEKYTGEYISVEYAERTGKWLNLQVSASVNVSPKVFGVYVDENTLDAEYPDVYVGFMGDNGSTLSVKRFYASFNIVELLDLRTAKGFTLHYKFNGVKQEKVFENPRKTFED